MEVKLEISGDASKVLNPIRIDPAKMNKAVGIGVRSLIRKHLQAYDQTHPNKLGGTRSHFYADAAKETAYTSDEDSATVSISKLGIRQRWLGGKIVAKNSKYLTIPAIAEAYNRSARSFSNLRFVRFGKSPDALAALVETSDGAIDKESGKKVRGKKAFKKANPNFQSRVFYWLKKEVYQTGDSGVIPSMDDVKIAAVQAAQNYLNGLTQKTLADNVTIEYV